MSTIEVKNEQYVKPVRQKFDLFLIHLHDYDYYLKATPPKELPNTVGTCKDIGYAMEEYISAFLGLFKAYDVQSVHQAIDTFGCYNKTKRSDNGNILIYLYNTHSIRPYLLQTQTFEIVPFNTSKSRFLELDKKYSQYYSTTNEIRSITYQESEFIRKLYDSDLEITKNLIKYKDLDLEKGLK